MVFIKLIVKAPNQKLDDQTVNCDLEWTVHNLKSHLSAVYPTKPRIEDQRLIYSGHLLKNEQSLLDILQPIDDNLTFTIHLVCAQRSLDSPKRNNNNINNNMASNNNSERLSNSPANDPHSQTSDSNARNNINENGFSSNPMNVTPNLVNPFFGMGITNTAPVVTTPEQMFQHMAHLQQAYAQYMAQYLSQNPFINNQTATQVFNNQAIPITVPPMTAQPPTVTQPVPPVPQANAPQIQPQPPQVQRMNAGPGGGQVLDDDEDPNNRDWLDWFYWMSRAVVLFSIIYFYSSFNRFLLVVVLAVMLYLYQANRNNRRRLPPNNNNNLNANPLVANNNNDINRVNDRDDDDLIDDVGGEETEFLDRPRAHISSNAAISDPRPTEERFTGLRFFWVIVSSLFTSLIPENPAVPVNLN